MSAPAQNPRPAPVRMTTRTFPSLSAAAIAARTSCSMIAVQAFNLSGRLGVMVAIRSVTSYCVSWFGMMRRIIYNANRVSNIHVLVTIKFDCFFHAGGGKYFGHLDDYCLLL